ncbi:MAG: tRNA (N6-threonylcarbamoyladenosine(37)-N6)-methyltransferase TrmO [Thermoprotei archaeon]
MHIGKPICFKPIGIVEKGIPRKCTGRSRYEIVSVIRIYDEYVEGLEGLEEFSHIIIIYYMHEAREYKLKGRPWGIEKYPLVGVFATRFAPRPNPIGITVVELVSINKPRLMVKGLDAWDNTPVLDIKPYTYEDIVKNPRVPWWFKEKWSEQYRRHRYDIIAPWLGPYNS